VGFFWGCDAKKKEAAKGERCRCSTVPEEGAGEDAGGKEEKRIEASEPHAIKAKNP